MIAWQQNATYRIYKFLSSIRHCEYKESKIYIRQSHYITTSNIFIVYPIYIPCVK